jgi:hypothetical protein
VQSEVEFPVPAHNFAVQFLICVSSSVFFWFFVGTVVLQRVRGFRFVFLNFCCFFFFPAALGNVCGSYDFFQVFFCVEQRGKFGNVLVASVPI